MQIDLSAEELTAKLKLEIVAHLNLSELPDFDADTPLFGAEGLGLDSIDALELVVLLDRSYGIRQIDPEQGREIFRTLRTLSSFILAQQQVKV